jgi:hypothetical protein
MSVGFSTVHSPIRIQIHRSSSVTARSMVESLRSLRGPGEVRGSMFITEIQLGYDGGNSMVK